MSLPTVPGGIRVSAAFDAGAIELIGITASDVSAAVLRLAIRRDATRDPACDFRQWFHFRVQGVRDRALELVFENAGDCTYPDGWRDYGVCASHDRLHWFRVPTTYDGRRMVARHRPSHDGVWYAYFEPYSWERHLDLVARAGASSFARVETLGETVEGRDLDAVIVGTSGERKANVWVIARQHPGETMAEWFVEGLLDRLLDAADPVARRLREIAVFHVVPNMNPDGSIRGNLRANAAGANLNREWLAPTRERSPEVLCVRDRMHATGVDLFLDVHGDEALPWVFVAGSEMLPGFTAEQMARQRFFCERLREASPDFQTVHGYPSGKYQADALKLASKYVGHTFGCLSLTLELPFKDNADAPMPGVGWTGERSAKLGAASLQAILAVVGR
jgi:murein tripeptide amidase MpaA